MISRLPESGAMLSCIGSINRPQKHLHRPESAPSCLLWGSKQQLLGLCVLLGPTETRSTIHPNQQKVRPNTTP